MSVSCCYSEIFLNLSNIVYLIGLVVSSGALLIITSEEVTITSPVEV